MPIEYDPVKDASNLAKHGLSLADAVHFDFETATALEDDRLDYGEIRWRFYGTIGGRFHCLVGTWRGPNLRVISLRRASADEVNNAGR